MMYNRYYLTISNFVNIILLTWNIGYNNDYINIVRFVNIYSIK